MTETARFVEQGWTRAVDVPPVRVLFYEGEGSGVVRIEHQCRVVEGTQIVCAPALQLGSGHTLVSEDPITVTPSILCPDCGLHGFITDGRWS